VSKPLVWIAAVACGLALIVSISASAASTSTSAGNGGDSHTFNKKLQLLNATVGPRESESLPNLRFPLMLPQPTTVNDQNNFGLG
jgi:hypothetical protein